jgi:ribosomal protein S27AE
VVPQPSLPRNVDLLAWFSEEEREVCGSCGERSSVSVPDALASFCLRCGVVAIEGVRLDVDGRRTV